MHTSVELFSKAIQKARRMAKRTRTGIACTRCKSTKTKCSDHRPCKHCIYLGAACTDVNSAISPCVKKPVNSQNCPEDKVTGNHFKLRGNETNAIPQQGFESVLHTAARIQIPSPAINLAWYQDFALMSTTNLLSPAAQTLFGNRYMHVMAAPTSPLDPSPRRGLPPSVFPPLLDARAPPCPVSEPPLTALLLALALFQSNQ
jgi:hypothetical protein